MLVLIACQMNFVMNIGNPKTQIRVSYFFVMNIGLKKLILCELQL